MKQKANVRFLLKTLWTLYKYGAFLLGSTMLLRILFGIIYLSHEDKVEYFVVPLHSGFIYEYDMQDGSLDGHHLSDAHHHVVVYSDVKRFVESGKTIYGYRVDLQGNPFYFICDYGDDCSNSQNLTDVELRKIIEKRHLPILYTSSSGTSRSDLKQEIKQFYKKYGLGHKPKWEYDKTWSTYRIAGEREKTKDFNAAIRLDKP